ncbi:MAG: bifunctional diaminohydroxyphosphoribosylaminopyrimidine deaminase/5-amino-6-(5-phosphoribosylamino)uracil reductase RibD, partial [Gammaproteobacteria bacterium]|nr:bifunctional diaminohydroxyphosphoribosylaminopyrimidine deaminase/5-amino-6-(5-phosphoribosylamino)uracil reductase RibD [Gammaproteobacteria bacterium]
MSHSKDLEYMAYAIQLARRGLYTTAPNPRVGCVIVRDGKVIGEGWHQRAGEAHAEIHALKMAAEAAAGATAYVTLEPCSHHGRTPPCSQALIDAGLVRVVAAMQDPNPQVAGSGLQQLQQAGIVVEVGVLQAEAEALNPGFNKRMRTGRPYVRSKLAMSLDGRTAMASGESKWITSNAARNDVHRLRARSSAILTGAGTVLADDPSLNVRLDGFDDAHQPIRVVLDPYLSTPVDAKMLSLPGRTIILTTAEEDGVMAALIKAGAEVVCMEGHADAIDLNAVMAFLAELQVNEVLLETGATLSGAMLQQGLVDEMVIYMAPHIMGNQARGLFNLPGLEEMSQRIELDMMDVRAVGKDWRITAKPKL